MKNSLSRSMFRFCLIANPILNAILLSFMFHNSDDPFLINQIILGSGISGIWSCICFSSVGDIQRERWYGTLSLLYISPTNFSSIIFGKLIGNTLLSMISFVISIGTSCLIFRRLPIITDPMLFFLGFVTMIICFLFISFILAYLFTLSRKTSLYQNLIEIPFSLFCGFIFPINILPMYFRIISYILSPTWAINILRASMSSTHFTINVVIELFIIFLHCIIQLVIILLLKRKIDHHVRIHASLEVS